MDKNIKMKDIKELGEQLGELQRVCREKKIPVMIAFEGYGAAGKGLQIGNLIQALDPRGFKVYAVKNKIIEPLDPRGFSVYATAVETKEEKMHPFLWRFWTKIPEKGRIAIFDTSWYRRVMIERFEGKTPEKELEKDFASIRAFEKQLTDDGMVIIKLFLKIDRKEQKKRFEKLLVSKDTAWRVSKGDLKRNHDFKEYKAINEEMLRKTDADYAPWTVIDATKKKEAKVAVYQAVIQAMEEAVARKELEEKGWNSLFWGNHDFPRVVSRFGNDREPYREKSAKMLAVLLHGMKGTPYIYQGEEIGMTNVSGLRIEDYQDIESVNFAEDRKKEGWEEEKIRTYLARNSRDHARTPMQWNAEKHAGFTAGTPWMAENQNYAEINVENSRKNPDSLFYFYQKLIALRRKNDTLVYGDFRLIEEENPDIFAYERNLGEKKLIVLCNFRDTAAEMKARYDLTKGTVLIHNDTESLTKEVWKLQPYEAYMIELLQ